MMIHERRHPALKRWAIFRRQVHAKQIPRRRLGEGGCHSVMIRSRFAANKRSIIFGLVIIVISRNFERATP